MSINIIHRPQDLAKLSVEEIDELLLGDSYNKANLRQLIRYSIQIIKDQQKAIDMYRDKKNNALDNFENLKNDMVELVDKYRRSC